MNVSEVEHAIIKAVELGLLEVRVNQVTQTVSVTKAMHRLVGESTLSAVSNKLAAWESAVHEMLSTVRSSKPDADAARAAGTQRAPRSSPKPARK